MKYLAAFLLCFAASANAQLNPTQKINPIAIGY